MTGTPDLWTRRQFSLGVAASSLLGRQAWGSASRDRTGFAFIGSSPTDTEGAIHVFRVSGSRWTAVQALPAAAPAHLASHPTLPVLYAVHCVGLWNNLPRGAISAYAIAPVTGQLTLLHTQPLSLAATYPSHAAVSPDGRYLFVVAERGGIYNLLPIDPDGALEPPSAIRKELGFDEGSIPIPKPAAPRQVVFHPDGATILAADTGRETITAFAFDHQSITPRHHVRTQRGAGPSRIVLSPSGDRIYAQHASDGSIAVHRTDTWDSRLPVHAHKARTPGPAILAMHPGGRFLVTANNHELTSLSIDGSSGHLTEASVLSLARSFSVLAFSPDGMHLLGAASSSGHILRLAFHASAGTVGAPAVVAQVDAASSLLFHSARL